MKGHVVVLLPSLLFSLPSSAQEAGQEGPPVVAPTPPEGRMPPGPTGQAAEAAPETPVKAKPFALGFWGALPFGEHLATAISPVGAPYQVNSMDTSWALGLVIDYALTRELHAFLDGGIYSQSVEVAKAGANGTSFWVYEMNGYSGNQQVGPFPDGVRYFMDTTAMRLGGAWHVNVGKLDAWGGLTFGAYRWTATYGTPDRSGKYGQATGTATGVTFMFGADMPVGESLRLGTFMDLASPAAGYTMNDLFNTGWTWTTEGHHVIGPYRFGIRFLMPM